MYTDSPLTLNGIRLFIVSPYNHTHEKKRTWRERLFTLPFHPFVKSTTVSVLTEVIEDGKIIKKADGIYMNYKTFQEFKKSIPNV